MSLSHRLNDNFNVKAGMAGVERDKKKLEKLCIAII